MPCPEAASSHLECNHYKLNFAYLILTGIVGQVHALVHRIVNIVTASSFRHLCLLVHQGRLFTIVLLQFIHFILIKLRNIKIYLSSLIMTQKKTMKQENYLLK